MIKIEIQDGLFQELMQMNGAKVLLSIEGGRATFVGSGEKRDQVIEYHFCVQSRNITVQYDLNEFKSLLRFAKRFKLDQIYLDEDLSLYSSDSEQFSFFIKPLERRVPVPGKFVSMMYGDS